MTPKVAKNAIGIPNATHIAVFHARKINKTIKTITMKQLLLTFLITFTFSLNAQYAVMYAVDLNEGAEEDYLKLEAFWSEIHKEAIKQGSQNGWSVWKRTPKETDEANAPEYIIFDGFESEEKMNAGYNGTELAFQTYKGKMSRRSIQRMLDQTGSESKERRTYQLKGVAATILAGGDIKKGDKMSVNFMNKKTDDFENYETQVWKPVAEKNILSGEELTLNYIINKLDNPLWEFEYEVTQ